MSLCCLVRVLTGKIRHKVCSHETDSNKRSVSVLHLGKHSIRLHNVSSKDQLGLQNYFELISISEFETIYHNHISVKRFSHKL